MSSVLNENMVQNQFEPPKNKGKPGSEADRVPIGFPFYENMEALAQSAKSCPLCALIQDGVQRWVDDWEDGAKNNKMFIEFSMKRHPIPRKERLWLTRRADGEQGFYVWAQCPMMKSWFNLLSAVGFSVDSGMASIPHFIL